MFQDDSKTNKQMFLIVFVAVILGQAASNMVFLFVPLDTAKELSHDFSVSTLVIRSALFFSILFTFIGGWLSDVIGRIRTIFLGVLLGAISSRLMIFLPVWQVASATYILSTIGTTITGVAFWVLMIENSSWKNRGLFIGLTLGCISLFHYQSQELATTLINRIGKNTTDVLGLITFVAAIVLMAWPAIKSGPLVISSESKARNLAWIPKTNFAAILFWVLLIQIVSQFGFAVEIVDVMFEQGTIIFFGTIMPLIAVVLSGWLSDKFSERKILIATLLLACLGSFLPFLILGTYRSLASQLLVNVSCNTAFSLPLQSFLSKILPEKSRGLTYGVFNGISNGMSIILLPIQSVIGYDYQKTLLYVILLTALVFLVWWKLKLPMQSEIPVGNPSQD